MKLSRAVDAYAGDSRTSKEVRGLKLRTVKAGTSTITSHLERGAWIEIFLLRFLLNTLKPSHLERGAWIEISMQLM